MIRMVEPQKSPWNLSLIGVWALSWLFLILWGLAFLSAVVLSLPLQDPLHQDLQNLMKQDPSYRSISVLRRN